MARGACPEQKPCPEQRRCPPAQPCSGGGAGASAQIADLMAQLDSAKEGRSAFGVLAAAACSFGLVALVAAANAHGEKLAAEARAKRDVRQTRAESKPVGPGLRRPSRRRSPACECCKLIEDGRRLADAGRARQGRRKETARRARAAPGPVAHGHGVPVAAPLGRPRLPVAVRLAEHRPGAAAVALVLTCISPPPRFKKVREVSEAFSFTSQRRLRRLPTSRPRQRGQQCCDPSLNPRGFPRAVRGITEQPQVSAQGVVSRDAMLTRALRPRLDGLLLLLDERLGLGARLPAEAVV